MSVTCSAAIRTAVLATALVLGATVHASPASASVTASVNTAATLVAKGARVDVSVVYTCSADQGSASLDLTLTQAVSRGQVASGEARLFFLPCDDTTHLVSVPIAPATGLAFKTGAAVTSGSFSSCDQSFVCSAVDLGAQVRVAK